MRSTKRVKKLKPLPAFTSEGQFSARRTISKETTQLIEAREGFLRLMRQVPLTEEEKSVSEVWIYDREFRTTLRRPNGTAIPLAVRSM